MTVHHQKELQWKFRGKKAESLPCQKRHIKETFLESLVRKHSNYVSNIPGGGKMTTT